MRILRAPAAVEDESAGGVAPGATASERPMSGWMNAIGDLDTPLNDTPPPKKEDKTNASPNDTPGRSAVAPPADRLPVGDDSVAKAKAETEAKEKAEAARLEAEKIAADAKGTDKTGDDADEKWPRNSTDWDKFKKKRAERETALRKEIETRDAKLKELEGKTTEYETKLKATPAVDPDLQSKVTRLEARNKELTEKITVLDVTAHPDFISYFEKKTKAAHEDASAILGEEKGKEFVKILGYPEGDWKNIQMEEFYAGLNDVEKSEIGTVRKELRAIERERVDEIKSANEHKTTLLTEGAAKAKADTENRTKVMVETFNSVTKAMQDPKNGNPVFQLRDGDDAWNSEVPKRIEAVKSLLLSSIKPDQVVRAAYQAVALPIVLQHYQADGKAWVEEKTKLEAQVKALSAAQPGGGGTGGNGTEVETKLPADTNPHDRAKAWAAKMAKAAQEM